MNTRTPLADIFPSFSENDWLAAVRRVRKGAANASESGIVFPRRADARAIVGPRAQQPWVGVARIDAGVPEEARVALDSAVIGGAGGIEFATVGTLHPLARGIAPEVLAELLRAVPEDMAVRVDAPPDAIVDLGSRAATAAMVWDSVAALARGVASNPAAEMQTAVADGRPWHAGGASDEQELGVVLATVVHHLRAGATGAACTLVADADQFRTIAKFRATRLLLARIAEVSGIDVPVAIHAETAWRSMSARDPHVNILRATSAAFGAAVGGADSITVLPFDALSGGDAHGRRLALNTQIILAQEAYISRVADPAAGSGAIEAATESLAAAAWQRFQDIESEGGIVAAISRGGLLRDIAETREARIAQAVAGVAKMVGVNAYAPGATATTANVRNEEKSRLVYRRVAEAFE
jgi:methylmalonyl-CoA mutase